MSRTGTGTIEKGEMEVVVAETGVAANAFIGVCLTQDPSQTAGSSLVDYIEKENGVGFTIHLTGAPTTDVTFDYYLQTKEGASNVVKDDRSVEVTDSGLASDFVVTTQFVESPSEKSGGVVQKYVVIDSATQFTLHLSNTPDNTAEFDYYFVVADADATISKGDDLCIVEDASVAADSFVIIMFTQDTSTASMGASVEWVEKTVGVGFTLHLNNAVQQDVTFHYLLA